MGLPTRLFILYLALVAACGYTTAGSIAKRASGDDASSSGGLSGLVNTVIDWVRAIPIIGGFIAGILDWLVQFISLFEIGTNGAIARLLGGALPCTIALNGTSCTGLTNNGGFGKVLMDVLDGIPPLLMPQLAKSLIELGIQLFIDPTIDVLFGGVAVNS